MRYFERSYQVRKQSVERFTKFGNLPAREKPLTKCFNVLTSKNYFIPALHPSLIHIFFPPFFPGLRLHLSVCILYSVSHYSTRAAQGNGGKPVPIQSAIYLTEFSVLKT